MDTQEARAFRTMMEDLNTAIVSPDSTALSVYSAGIIDKEKRDEIFDYEKSGKKTLALLTAVESQIQLRPSVYYEFVEILSKSPAMHFVCQKMTQQIGKSYLRVTIVLLADILVTEWVMLTLILENANLFGPTNHTHLPM